MSIGDIIGYSIAGLIDLVILIIGIYFVVAYRRTARKDRRKK
jgi:uncharacterized membrane protein (Fun14 family)